MTTISHSPWAAPAASGLLVLTLLSDRSSPARPSRPTSDAVNGEGAAPTTPAEHGRRDDIVRALRLMAIESELAGMGVDQERARHERQRPRRDGPA